MYPGSKWWKIDFHVHTPASLDDYGDTAASEEDILKAAMQSRLDCIVIADHNSGGWIEKLQAKNKELQSMDARPDWYRELAIFPGVEITVANSGSRVHLIAVFDSTCDAQKIVSVLGACGISEGFGDPKNTSTTKSFIETVATIEDNGGIAIPAHIDTENGLLHGVTSLNNELKNSLENIHAAEFCNIHAFDGADIQLKKAVENLAKLGGSDAHCLDKIGKHYSWIKMDKLSLAGLRLAILDHKYCVKNQDEDPNHLPDIWINNLEIRNMKYCGRITGQPFKFALNPELNTFIGGRGSGKSTLLESIRVVARCDLNLSAELPKIKEKIDKFMSVKDGAMLPDTEILLELWRAGKQFRLRWRSDQQGNVLEEKATGGEWQNTEPGSLQERFPISVFSQKQIEELASNPRGLLRIIDQSSVVNRSEWNSRWENTKSMFMQLRERERDLMRRISDEAQIRIKLGDLENDLKQYEAKGHGEILKNYQRRVVQKTALPSDEVFDNALTNIRDLASSIGLPDFPVHLFEDDAAAPELGSILEQASLGFKGVAESLEKSAQKIEEIKIWLNQSVAGSMWSRSLQASIAAYNELVAEYERKGSQLNLSLYGEWTQQYRQLQQTLSSIDSIKAELSDVQNQIKICYADFFTLRDELLKRRRDFLDSVIGSNPFVRMELVQFGDKELLENEYRGICNIDSEAFSSSILDRQNAKGILWELYNWQGGNMPEAGLSDLLESVKSKTIAIVTGQTPSAVHIDNRLKTRLQEFGEKQPSVFDNLCAWFPEDLLQVKYSKDPSSGRFENIGSGSAGQKAAAILAFLLGYGDKPLIIDQPEDDLDNALIYDLIVSQIHKNKTKRQLIIATHNPNIVVNGIAELVVALKFSGGLIQLDAYGGLDSEKVRDSICTIMEGGEDALNRRYKRITLKR